MLRLIKEEGGSGKVQIWMLFMNGPLPHLKKTGLFKDIVKYKQLQPVKCSYVSL